MLEFLRKVFGKKRQENVAVTSDELDAWFQAQIEERVRGLDGPLQEFYGAVRRLRQQLREQREQLLAAPIVDEDKVEARVKSVVLGHRENYCRELGIFINGIGVPQETELQQGRELYHETQAQLDEFAQQTAKSFGATRHLFYKEVDAIAASLRELSDAAVAFHQVLEKRGIVALEDIQTQIAWLKQEKEKRQRLREELSVKKSRLDSARKQHAVKCESVSLLHKCEEFLTYQTLLEKRDALASQCASAERDITALFLGLERALRKYEYLAVGEDVAAVQHYMHNAKEALVRDTSLSIWIVLVHIQEHISSLGLKEDQENKLKEMLGQTSKERLSELRRRYLALLDEREAVVRHVENNPILTRLKEEEYKRDHFQQQIVRFENDVAELEKKLGEKTVEDSCMLVGQKITAVLGVPVSIIPSP